MWLAEVSPLWSCVTSQLHCLLSGLSSGSTSLQSGKVPLSRPSILFLGLGCCCKFFIEPWEEEWSLGLTCPWYILLSPVCWYSHCRPLTLLVAGLFWNMSEMVSPCLAMFLVCCQLPTVLWAWMAHQHQYLQSDIWIPDLQCSSDFPAMLICFSIDNIMVTRFSIVKDALEESWGFEGPDILWFVARNRIIKYGMAWKPWGTWLFGPWVGNPLREGSIGIDKAGGGTELEVRKYS